VLTWLYAGHSASDPAFGGSLGEASCAALLRGLLAGGRTGTLQLEPSNATVRFSEGSIIDASMPPLTGERALMRILTLSTGSYELTFGPLETAPSMKFELSDLSGRGLRHVHNWEAIQAQLKPLDQVLTVDYRALSGQVNELPPGLWSLLRLFDGKRTVGEVIEDSSLDELITGQAIAKLKGLEIFEQQRARRGEQVLDESSIESEIGALSLPVPSPEEWRVQYTPSERREQNEGFVPPPPMLESPGPSEASDYATRAALDAHARVEESFFDSPSEEMIRDTGLDRQSSTGGIKVGMWAIAAAALLGVVVLIYKAVPTADPLPPTASIGPAVNAAAAVQPAVAPVVTAAPAAVAAAQPAQVLAPAPAVAVAQPSAPAAAEATNPQADVANAAATAPAVVAPAAPNPAVNTLLAEAQKNYDKGRFQKALALYDQANALAPEDPAVALGRGLNYYELGDLDHASAALTKALELDGKSARAELMLGAIAQERHQNDMAKQHYKRYLELDPKGEHAAETRELLTRLGG
jgi:hypothetical protein